MEDGDAWIFSCWLARLDTRLKNTVLCDFTLDVVRALLARAINRVKSMYTLAHLYGRRHGGAAHDLLSRWHTLLEVKHKGRLATDGSLKMYAKATRLRKEMDKLPRETQALGNNVKDHFAEMIAPKARSLPLPIAVPARLAAPL